MTDELKQQMLKSYERHGRHRSYSLGETAKRHLTHIFVQCAARSAVAGCSTDQLFHDALDRLTAAGLNVVRPPDIPARELPKPVKDPVSGEPIKNLWMTPMPADEAGQRSLVAERKALAALSPGLARHMQRMATDPARYLLQLQTEEETRLRKNAAESRYNEKLHALNVFVGSNETDRVEFVRANRDDPEWVAVCEREARPVDLSPIFATSSTVKGRIWKAPVSERSLLVRQIVEGASADEARLQKEAFEREQREAEEAAARAQRDLAALKDKQAGVVRRPGQIITMPRGG